LDSEINENEVHDILLKFKNNKSPGNDGLSKEFYQTFWKQIAKPLLDSYSYGLDKGMLSTSQRQAIITLLDKPGKDRIYLSNWRPISLVNFDYKLLTKTLAERVRKSLPIIISESQTGYVLGRSTFDSVRLVQDIIYLADRDRIPAILLTIDFQKAFDSIEWDFIYLALQKFNFGPIFIKWVRTLYNNISSCVCNNGKTSGYFTLRRGVRQGDPLSPYLFIIAVEILALVIKRNAYIKGYSISTKEIKMTQYADDLTLILTDVESIRESFNVLKLFANYSGLQVNSDKSEGMLIGPWRNTLGIPNNIRLTNGPIRLLGIYLTANPREYVTLNFQSKIDALLRQLHWWKARDLSLRGKVLIVKSKGIALFQYLAALVPIPQYVIKEVNSILYEFIWNGKTDKVKRVIFEQSFSQGGYNMISLGDIIESASIMWIKRYLDDIERDWKYTMAEICNTKHLNILLRSNFNFKELPLGMPEYYRDSLSNWSFSNAANTLETCQQCLWYNDKIKIGGKTVFNEKLQSIGMWVIGDLFNDTDVIPFESWLQRGATEKNRLLWCGLIRCIRQNYQYSHNDCSGHVHTIKCGLQVKSNFIELSHMLQKHLKINIKERKLGRLGVYDFKYKIKYESIYGVLSQDEWETIFLIPHHLPLENKMKDFQYKIIMRIVPTNYLLYKMKKVNSQLCTFCMLQPETIEHLFYDCIEVRNIWLAVCNEFKQITGYVYVPTRVDCILGIYDKSSQYFTILNIMLLIVKYYILKCKYEECSMSIFQLSNIFKEKIGLSVKLKTEDMYAPLQQMFQTF